VDALIARMTSDAKARIASLRAEADAEVAALVEARARESSRDHERALAARRVARERAFDVERAVAQRQAAARVLTAQHAFLDRVFARAEALAVDADSDARYLDALPRQLSAVMACLGGQPTRLRCRPALAERLQSLLADRSDVEALTDATLPAGFSAALRDGHCTIDCTLSARLSALRPKLEAALLSRGPG
jgi:vacuolar-type H+-ATPase subunit E/Vma4